MSQVNEDNASQIHTCTCKNSRSAGKINNKRGTRFLYGQYR